MNNICPKGGSERVLLLTSYTCDCHKRGSGTSEISFHAGQELRTSDEVNEALADGCCVRTEHKRVSVYITHRRRTSVGVFQVWTSDLQAWRTEGGTEPNTEWNFSDYQWYIHHVDGSKLNEGPDNG